MLRVGLTGGIGSGKTAVSDHFAELGAPVIDTDVLAREVVEPGEPALEQLVDAFGRDILLDDGSLNRERLRATVFDDPEARRRVEAIVHPAIRQRLREQLKSLERQAEPYCIIVVPLLVETDFQEMVDRVLVVEAPRERRIGWVMARSDMRRDEVEAIMESQASDEERASLAHDIIYNDGSLDDLKEKVDRLHAKYLVVPRLVK